jgi:hypothetical protein
MISWEENVAPDGSVTTTRIHESMPEGWGKRTKRFRGFTLVNQSPSYWWYGDQYINIALTSSLNGRKEVKWRLCVEFHFAELEIVVVGTTESKVRREFSRRVKHLKPLVAAL